MPSAPEAPRPPRHPAAVRVAFVLLVLSIPVEMAVQWRWSEPFPAVTQPAFAFSANPLEIPDAVPGAYATVEVLFDDGTSTTYLDEQLLPWTAGIPRDTILREAIVERAEVPAETAHWLVERIGELDERTPIEAVVRIHFTRTDAHTLERIVDAVRQELTIPLTDEP